MAHDPAFGRSPEGDAVHRVTIGGGALTASILTWGAVVQDLRLDGHEAPLVLGFDRFSDYVERPNYFGAVAGRHANRIRDGRFSIAGRSCQIDAARPQIHGLHGGSHGYARRNWRLAGFGADFCTLALHDPDGTMGFPGSVDVQCSYRVRAEGVLSVDFTATTDEPTLCNLAQHTYFNLDDGGSSDILGHRLQIMADAYLPADAQLIPTGEVRPVDGTDFDFRTARTIRRPDGEVLPYDNNFCLSAARGALRQAARARGASSGVEMEVWTTEPGLQFYTGHFLQPGTPGLDGRSHDRYAGFCLEAQVWPDSPNRPYFPQALLRPDEVYRQTTEFRFRRD